MLTRFAMISFEELKFVAPRVALYTAVAYATIRAVGFVTSQATRLAGLDNNNR
jgi:hypothetical protein